MNKMTVVVSNMTPGNLLDALYALSDSGIDDDTPLEIGTLKSGAVTISAKPPAPHKGVKQRCAHEDADGRRCIRGPRHRENHRYE